MATSQTQRSIVTKWSGGGCIIDVAPCKSIASRVNLLVGGVLNILTPDEAKTIGRALIEVANEVRKP